MFQKSWDKSNSKWCYYILMPWTCSDLYQLLCSDILQISMNTGNAAHSKLT